MKAGWETKKFGEVLDIRNGRNQREVESDKGQFPILGSAGKVMGYATDYLCESGTTIIGRKGTINSPIYVETCFWNVDTAFGLAPKADLDSKFLHYFCLSYDFSLLNCGTTIPSLVKTDLLKIEIPLPPLDEQRRIVAVLDKAFAGIATATANAQKNLTNARALFESYLQSVFTQRGADWIVEPITKNVRFIDYRGKTPPKRAEGVRLITAKNVKMGFVRRTPEEFIDPAAYVDWMTRGFPKRGDVLFTTEAPLGNVAQLDTDEKVVIGQRLITMQPMPQKIDCTFLKYMLCSAPLQEAIRSHATGATVLGIKAKLLKTILIFYPKTITAQIEIVEKLDRIYDQVDLLAELHTTKLAALTELKQSLLQKAFAGELT